MPHQKVGASLKVKGFIVFVKENCMTPDDFSNTLHTFLPRKNLGKNI